MSWILDKLFGTAELQSESDRLDEQLRQQNAIDAVKYGPEWLAQTEANLQAGRPDASGEVAEGFQQGWDEGAANVRGFVGGATTGFVGTVFKLLPWYLWLAIAAGVAWKLGFFKRKEAAA